MPTVCVHCGLKALVDGETAPIFDETPEAHMARCHPDVVAMYQERRHLEAQVWERLNGRIDKDGDDDGDDDDKDDGTTVL